jgi:hypothetical protein
MDNIHPASIKINKVLEGLVEVHPASINPQRNISLKLFMFVLFALLIIYIIKRYLNNKKNNR